MFRKKFATYFIPLLMLLGLLGACMTTTNNNDISDLNDLKSMQGLWKPNSAVLSGQAMPDVVLQGMSLEITEDNYTVLAAGSKDQGTLTLDETLKQMQIFSLAGPNQGKALTAIYKLEDDRLSICYDLSGQSFPDDFTSEPGTQNYLVIYTRVK